MILNNSQEIDNNKQWVFVTLTVDGDDCQFTHVAPANLSGQDLQDFVDVKEDSYKFDILRDMYPDAPKSVKNDLADLEQWILDGVDVEKVAWTNKHPDIISVGGSEKDNLLASAKELADTLTFDNIEDHIETVFGNLNAAQQNSLKKLYKVVLYLVRK
jgi:hypothetical protein